ncbi:MAG: hypothetical protein P4K83_03315 [Terracidiphilus sp.]|nr:hypothetical protein [Terracidiphilus sp.]
MTKFGRTLSLSLALITALTLSACKSGNQQSANQPAQPGAGQQPAAQSAQPGTNQQSAAADQSGASSQQASYNQQSGGSAPAAAPASVNLPAGTRIHVRLDRDLGSKINEPGDNFTATVSDDIVVNNQVIVAKGSRADGTVTDAKPLGRFKGGAELGIRLDRIHTRWGSYPVNTSSIDRAEKGKGKRTAGFIGGGAGLGALIGGLTGGGKGAAIGAAAGAGAGTAGTAFTGNHQIVLPAETLLTFRLENSVRIVEQR